MAATERPGGILLAALALPGLLPAPAVAENPPERAVLAFKHLYYHDYQDDLERVTVNAPSVYGTTAIGENWGVEGSLVVDAVSGASPRYYTTKSGASKMDDTRTAGDVKFTRYYERSAYAAGLTYSTEHDYVSRAVSLEGRWSSADNNTTFNAGLGYADDRIDPVNDIVDDESKRTVQGIVGITRALTMADLVQAQASYSDGHGYYSDPYKLFDNRPDDREQGTLLLRWNHHFSGGASTLRSTYRYYRDSFGIRGHRLAAEWVKPLRSDRLLWTSSLTYDSQSAADFYVDPPQQAPFPTLPEGSYSSLDQRLAAFGGVLIGQKLAWTQSANWAYDIKAEYCEQRADWRVFGSGSPDLDTFHYYSFQVGITYRY